MGLAYLACLRADRDLLEAESLATTAVALARARQRRDELAFALMVLGDAAAARLDDAAVAALTEAVAVAETVDEGATRYASTAPHAVVSEAASNLGGVWSFRDNPTALQWQRRALDAGSIDDRARLARMHAELALVNTVGGHYSTAAALTEDAVRLLGGTRSADADEQVSFARGRVLHCTGQLAAAEQLLRASIDRARAGVATGGRILFLHFQSCALVDLLVDRGRLSDAAEVLGAAELLHPDGADDSYLARLEVRRARLLRMSGHDHAARALLRRAEARLDPAELRPELVILLVESAFTAGSSDEREHRLTELARLSRVTKVQPFPWERRLLADLGLTE
jgi:hypothetical protein